MTTGAKSMVVRAAVACVAIVCGAGVASAANPACQWYVTTSAKQQQENAQKACGFKGPEWTLDTKVHASFCESHAPEEWKALAQKRQQMLDGCGKK